MSAAPAALIAVDWGTTSARAYRLDARGEVTGVHAAPLGIQHVTGGYPDALAALLGDWSGESAPRLACGMIGSRQGWVEAPYVDCPGGLDALARGIVRTADGALAIVPGLACRGTDGVPDVMRGEETQILGAIADGAKPTLAILPGTHSKWALVRAGAITAFSTHMTGELFAVLREHSILGRMLAPLEAAFAAEAFALGARRGAERGAELLHLLFGVRTLALLNGLTPEKARDYLSGLLIGCEIAAGRAWVEASGVPLDAALLIGSRALCGRYATALREAGTAARIAPEDAAARGLWRVARAASLVR
ncbi:MAG TPA: 2-dehydro-3-deoxygalactonokinase [Casimicrobiaceae bacterium]|nr:2-dehydro-3-deoxygalactonokinase [Casimicrobiaceae bacterium]